MCREWPKEFKTEEWRNILNCRPCYSGNSRDSCTSTVTSVRRRRPVRTRDTCPNTETTRRVPVPTPSPTCTPLPVTGNYRQELCFYRHTHHEGRRGVGRVRPPVHVQRGANSSLPPFMVRMMTVERFRQVGRVRRQCPTDTLVTVCTPDLPTLYGKTTATPPHTVFGSFPDGTTCGVRDDPI